MERPFCRHINLLGWLWSHGQGPRFWSALSFFVRMWFALFDQSYFLSWISHIIFLTWSLQLYLNSLESEMWILVLVASEIAYKFIFFWPSCVNPLCLPSLEGESILCFRESRTIPSLCLYSIVPPTREMWVLSFWTVPTFSGTGFWLLMLNLFGQSSPHLKGICFMILPLHFPHLQLCVVRSPFFSPVCKNLKFVVKRTEVEEH